MHSDVLLPKSYEDNFSLLLHQRICLDKTFAICCQIGGLVQKVYIGLIVCKGAYRKFTLVLLFARVLTEIHCYDKRKAFKKMHIILI